MRSPLLKPRTFKKTLAELDTDKDKGITVAEVRLLHQFCWDRTVKEQDRELDEENIQNTNSLHLKIYVFKSFAHYYL